MTVLLHSQNALSYYSFRKRCELVMTAVFCFSQLRLQIVTDLALNFTVVKACFCQKLQVSTEARVRLKRLAYAMLLFSYDS